MVRILRVDVVAQMRQRKEYCSGLVCVASQVYGLGTPSPDAFSFYRILCLRTQSDSL